MLAFASSLSVGVSAIEAEPAEAAPAQSGQNDYTVEINTDSDDEYELMCRAYDQGGAYSQSGTENAATALQEALYVDGGFEFSDRSPEKQRQFVTHVIAGMQEIGGNYSDTDVGCWRTGNPHDIEPESVGYSYYGFVKRIEWGPGDVYEATTRPWTGLTDFGTDVSGWAGAEIRCEAYRSEPKNGEDGVRSLAHAIGKEISSEADERVKALRARGQYAAWSEAAKYFMERAVAEIAFTSRAPDNTVLIPEEDTCVFDHLYPTSEERAAAVGGTLICPDIGFMPTDLSTDFVGLEGC